LVRFLKYCFLIGILFPLLATAQDVDALQFIENKGQFDSKVLFRVQLNSGYVFLEQNAITFKIFDEKNYAEAHQHLHKDHQKTDETIIYGHVFKYKFYKSRTNLTVRGQKPFFEKFNYFLGNDKSKWASNVLAFSEVIYTNVYDGINLKVYSLHGQIKYEWIVSPGADASQIELELVGLDSTAIKNNALLLHTSIGTFPDKNLEVWQSSGQLKKVYALGLKCNYVLKKNRISYQFPEGYNKDMELVIDPILVFSTYSGSRGDNFGYTATFDVRGDLYAGGITDNKHGEYPVTTGAFQTTCQGGKGREPVTLPCDITISKYDSSGKKLLYATYIGGSDDDYPHSMIVNSDTELVVFGTTYSKNFPMAANGYDTSHNSNTSTTKYTDIVVFKLSKNGDKLKGATFFGGSNHDGLTDSALKFNYADDFRGEVLTDKADNIFVVSSTNSSNIPLKNESKSALEGKADGLCLKFSKNLDQLLWSTYFGGNGSDGIYSLEFDKSENIYVAGGTQSSNLPVHSTALNKTLNGGTDGFMAIFIKSSLSLTNATYYGTSAYDQIYFLEIDKSGDVYGTGQTTGNITASANVYSNKPKTGQFILIADENLDKIKKQTVFGNRQNNPEISPSAFLVDSCGNIYLSGWGSYIKEGRVGTTTGLPITSNALQKTTDGSDFYLAVFAKNLSRLLFASYYGGNQSDDHVDGGTSRFDKRGVIYQSVCSSCPNTGGPTLNDFPTTAGSAFPKNVSWRCSNAAFKIDFQINNIVKADFIPDPTLCGPALIQFTNQSTGNGTYHWDFGDGKTSTVVNPLHSYPNTGKYTIKLIAIDSNTCNISDTITKVGNVLQRPTAAFEVKNIPCTGKVEITNKSNNYTGLSWDYGNGHKDSVVNPLAYTYTPAGRYTIRLIADQQKLCEDTAFVTVYIRSDTFVMAKFIPDSLICGSALVQFTNLSNGKGSFKWLFGDGNTSNLKNPQHTFAAGKFTTKLIAIDSTKCNISDTVTRTITALVPPVADFEINNIPCTKKVSVVNKSKDYTTANWDYDDGHTDSTINPPVYEYTGPGLYRIKLITDAKKMCTDTAFVDVFIRNSTLVKADFIPDTTLCEAAEVQFTNLSIGTAKFFWDFDDGNSSTDDNPKHSFTKDGSYQVKMIAIDSTTCNVADTAMRTVNVVKRSLADFEIKTFECSSRIEITNKSKDFETADWDFGNGDTSELTNPPNYEYKAPGLYKITLISDAKKTCPDTTVLEVDIIGTPDDRIIPLNVFTPDGDGINDCFRFDGYLNDCSKFKLIIYNRWGQKMFETKDITECWNGNVNNGKKLCPEGTYLYICEYKGLSNQVLPRFEGTVTLIRK
jgi:gliding motility-associated-like protein